ncbi:hypothetical protein HHS34_005630 [Acidithiobacillus montserratensis]|uniref:Uncharacterized protein n=1 Tax=Acidithiobacillus montserratensis TaxID=2729135 RepID=A0ACD5HIG5_9PROT|nr:hypothetical protein [Acidithiobacillus montserratensis]MBU2747842.1 hypothetical protein [Acidithiobacillus montserratensis]
MATNQLMQRNNLVNAFIDVNDDKTKAALAQAKNQVGEAEWKKGFSPETQKVAREAMKEHGARYETELKGRLVDVQTAQTKANGEEFSKLRVTLENDAGKITLSEDLNSEFAQRLVTKLDTATKEHAGKDVTIGGFASPVERNDRTFVDHVATMKDAEGKEIPAAPDHFKLAKESVDIAQEALKGSKLGEEKKKKMLNQVAKSAREEYFDSVASTFHQRFVDLGVAPEKQERGAYPALEAGVREPDGNWINLSLHVPTEGKEHEGQFVGTLQRKGPEGYERAPLVFQQGEKGLESTATFPGEKPLDVVLSKSEYGKTEVTISRFGEPIHERPALLRQNEALKAIPNHREGQLLQQSLGVDPAKMDVSNTPARAPVRSPSKGQEQAL